MTSPSISDGGSPKLRASSPLNPNNVSPGTSTPRSPLASPSLPRRRSSSSFLLSHAASAAEARAVEHRDETLELGSLVDPSQRLQFFRCIDTDILPALSTPAQRAASLGIMQTLLTLLDNALEKGLAEKTGEPKYLSVKLSNPAIRKKLDLDSKVSREGTGSPALDYLHLCGWRLHIKQFQEYMEYPSAPTSKQLAELKLGAEILQERVEREKEVAARSSVRQKAAKEEEDSRKGKALLQIKEDRLRRKEVDEREKAARARRVEAASAAAAAVAKPDEAPRDDQSPLSATEPAPPSSHVLGGSSQ